MDFVKRGEAPRDIHEQMLQNNRDAIAFSMENVYRPITVEMICTLAGILTREMDGGGETLREADRHVIAALATETYMLPCAKALPDLMQDLCAYLGDQNNHPLLKAAVSHAWFLMVRPFNEGNERLARLIAFMVLMKAKYTFFSEVSLSAIIAQDGYRYYKTMADSIRVDSHSDMTYLIKYYIETLGMAVDEIHERRRQRDNNQTGQAVGAAPDPPAGDDDDQDGNRVEETVTATVENADGIGEDVKAMAVEILSQQSMGTAENMANAVPEGESSEEGPSEADMPEEDMSDELEQALTAAGYSTMGLSDNTADQFGEPKPKSYMDMRRYLTIMSERPSELKPLIAARLLEWMKNGKSTFYRTELTEGIVDDTKRSSNIVCHFRTEGIIITKDRSQGKSALYGLNIREDYSLHVMNMIYTLITSKTSPKDRRIGQLLLKKLESGYIERSDFKEIGALSKWPKDMRLCVMLGLVTKVNEDCYSINKELKPRHEEMDNWQKSMASAMYNSFGQKRFTSEMIVAALDYSESTTSATLHTFTLMGILDCEKGNGSREMSTFQFLITPQEHPEYFEAVA